MKLLIAAAILFSMSSFASEQNCPQREAQFLGLIKNKRVQKVDNGLYDCYFKISFVSYQASGVCPLHAGEVENYEFPADKCNFEIGDSLSGYLVEKNGQITIE